MYKPWVNAEEYLKAEEQKRFKEEEINHRDYLIQEIITAMNTLRKNYPEVEMRIYFSSNQTMEDICGTFIDGLDCSFSFE